MSPISTTYNEDIIDKKIQIGSVVSIDIDGIDHPKWNVILDITEDKCLVASVFINSEINFRHINSQELINLQYEIDTESIKFLDHNSVIDCSKIFTEPYEKYKEALVKNAVRKKGDLPESEVQKIYEKVRTSKNITGKTKKKFKKLFNSDN
jgi:hypothetical protein